MLKPGKRDDKIDSRGEESSSKVRVRAPYAMVFNFSEYWIPSSLLFTRFSFLSAGSPVEVLV